MTTKGDNTPTNTLEEDFAHLDKLSEYNKLSGRGHGDLEDTCYICGVSPSGLKKHIKEQIAQAVNKARNDSLLDLERWIKLHDLDTEMILDGIEHMVVSNLQVPDQPRLDNTDRIKELETPNQVESME